jgi:hypothetical protein
MTAQLQVSKNITEQLFIEQLNGFPVTQQQR